MIAKLPDGLTEMGAAIVTVGSWTMGPDGDTYLYFWCADWHLMTDAQVPTKRFRSTEKWQLVGVVDGKPACVLPGCQVKAMVYCDAPPARSTIYRFGESP